MVPLRSAKIDIAINQQAFDLVEHRRMGDIGVAAIHRGLGRRCGSAGCFDSMVRTCTGEVRWVRSNMLALK